MIPGFWRDPLTQASCPMITLQEITSQGIALQYKHLRMQYLHLLGSTDLFTDKKETEPIISLLENLRGIRPKWI